VIVAEMINTAIEAVVDLITPDLHPLAAIAKNVAAGGVLVAAIVALIVGYLIFFPKVDSLLPFVIETLEKTPAYLSLIALIFTIVAVVVGKSLTKKGRPVQGGMPSGHSALATAAATTTLFLTSNSLIICLGFFMAFLVAESRIENKIHSLPEVLMGCFVGFFITLAVFQLLVW
jgi:diacylglycerol kinase (ATP)